MANITGGMSYGGYGGSGSSYGGDGRYQSFNSKNYGNKSTGSGYGSSENYSGGLGVYGDYSYGKSTLDKYKSQKEKEKAATSSINRALIPDITGSGTTADPNT